mmetsp:Transcript_55818/g.133039  ORF Transcript_55818/g.133039 Transcript_55818/m.133039 type:complete len:170 (+) Transcript_55818:89-598(+)
MIIAAHAASEDEDATPTSIQVCVAAIAMFSCFGALFLLLLAYHIHCGYHKVQSAAGNDPQSSVSACAVAALFYAATFVACLGYLNGYFGLRDGTAPIGCSKILFPVQPVDPSSSLQLDVASGDAYRARTLSWRGSGRSSSAGQDCRPEKVRVEMTPLRQPLLTASFEQG